jgi:ribose transport system permease protein
MTFLKNHQKTLGLALLLIVLCGVTGAVQPAFLRPESIADLLRYTGLYGILAVAAAFVIVTGGIDLSIGSLIGLSGVMLPMLIQTGAPFFSAPVPVPVAFGLVLLVGAVAGVLHGWLVTRWALQPFLVTLCGLFIYRGLARRAANDESQGFADGFAELRTLATGSFLSIPYPFLILLGLAVAMAIFLKKTVWGRHLLALGRNETAARYSGISTGPLKVLCYTLCGVVTALGGMLLVLDNNSAMPSNFGNSYELYAIAGAVLGGCSLRGGECRALGLVLGAALVQVALQMVLFLNVQDSWKLAIVGSLILAGVLADEVLHRWSRRSA